MGTTPTYSWPYPEPTDPVANGAQDIEDLALAVETTVSTLPGGKILQVVSAAKTDTFTTTSTSYTDLTGLSVSITPSSATSTILVGYSVIAQGLNATNMGGIQLVRDSTAILVANAAGSRSVSSSIVSERSATHTAHQSNFFVDSPATTSATTYKLQIRTYAGTIWVNRTNSDIDSVAYYRGTSTLFAMEVSS